METACPQPAQLAALATRLRALRLGVGDEQPTASMAFALERDIVAGLMERLWAGAFERLDTIFADQSTLPEFEAICEIIAASYARDAARAITPEWRATSRGRAGCYAGAALLVRLAHNPSTSRELALEGLLEPVRIRSRIVSVVVRPFVLPEAPAAA